MSGAGVSGAGAVKCGGKAVNSTRRSPWLLVIVLPAGLAALVAALWVYVSLTAEPLHPGSASVPSRMRAAPPPQRAGAVERARMAVRESVAAQSLPGVSVAAGMHGEVVWEEGFGYANLWRGEPVTAGHRFRLGSASILLASASAGLLIEEGRLRIDDEIQKYVPDYPRKQWPVTLRMLMGHTAGLADGELPRREHCESAAEALKRVEDAPLRFPPDSGFRPAVTGWVLVSAAIEAAAGKPLPEWIRQRVLDPLEMRDTVVDPGPEPALVAGEDPPPAILFRELIHDPEAELHSGGQRAGEARRREAAYYAPRFRSNPRHGRHMMRLIDCSCLSGAGAYWSTPADLVRFGMAFAGGRLLRPETVDLLAAPQRLSTGEVVDYGLGWQTWSVPLAGKAARAIGHDGELAGGQVATVLVFPEYEMVVAVAANIVHADTHSIAVKVAQALAEPAAGGQRR